MAKKLFCSIDTPERAKLVEQLKGRFPDKTENDIIAEINCASIGGELPSIDQMDNYYKAKEKIAETRQVNVYWPKRENIIVLSERESAFFDKIKLRHDGKLPISFFDNEHNRLYVKANRNPKSHKYNVVNKDSGEIIMENIPLYTHEEYEHFLESKQALSKEPNNWNESRSLAFKARLTTPSKGNFKHAAKKYLLEAIYSSKDIKENTVNVQLIDKFVDSLPEAFWEHVITYALDTSQPANRTQERPDADIFGLTTNNPNFELDGWALNRTIPKIGLIKELEKKLGIQLDGKKVKMFVDGELTDVELSSKTDYDTLKRALIKYGTELWSYNDRMNLYAKSKGITRDDLNTILNELSNNDTISASKQKEDIEKFSPLSDAIVEISEKYNQKYIKYLEQKGIKLPELLAHIIFNRDSYAKDDTVINRLVTIFHEPFHAMEILLSGSDAINKVYSAADKFFNTEYGKSVKEEIVSKNTKYPTEDITSEFLANMFALMFMPEDLMRDFKLQESENLGTIMIKAIDKFRNQPKIIKYFTGEIEEVELYETSKITEDEKGVIRLLKQIYNACISFVAKYTHLIQDVNKYLKDTTKTKTITTTRKELREKIISKENKDLYEFVDALENITSSLENLLNAEIFNNSIGGQQKPIGLKEFRNQNLTKEYIDQSVLDEVASMTFTSEQREDRVRLLSNVFTEVVNDLIGQDNVNRKGYIVNHLSEIVDSMRDIFSDENAEDDYQKQEFKKIRDNWQTLMVEAANIIFSTEHVALDFIYQNVNETENNNGDITSVISDGENSDDGTKYDSKDGWMIKAREVDLRDTLSQETRKILATIEQVDNDGEPIVDDLGFARYIDSDYAHVRLIERISQISSADEFDEALESMVTKYPWMRNVINRLNSDPIAKAKFYVDFRKEFVPYWIQKNGKTIQINKKSSILYNLEEWRRSQEQGIVYDKDSIYDSNTKIVHDNANIGLNIVNNLKKLINDTGFESFIGSDSIKSLDKALKMVGISLTEDEFKEVISSTTEDGINDILTSLNIIFRGVDKGISQDTILTTEYDNAYKKIAEQMDVLPFGVTVASFKEGGNTYQSYSNPSYLGRLLNSIKGNNWQQYFEKEFAQYNHFFKNGQYRIDWLRKLTDPVNGGKYRAMLDRKVVLTADGKNFNRWSRGKYLDVILNEFFVDDSKSTGEKEAYYYLPLLADAESAEFIKFVRYTDTSEKKGSGWKTVTECVVPKLTDVVEQEIDRIIMVHQRAKARAANNQNAKEIASFDINGRKFMFFPQLNTYKTDDGKSFIAKYIELSKINQSDARQFAEDTIFEIMESQADNFVQEEVNRVSFTPKQLKDFYYNNALAYTQIVNILTTDLAYYKDLNDFQKRFKEVYGMTSRMFTLSKYGKSSQNVVYLKDIEIKSNSYREVDEILSKAVSDGRMSSKERDRILSKYSKVNIADAQAFRSLDSYRSVLDMQGKWTDRMEEAYNRIINNKFDAKDIDVVWTSIKPFTYSQISVDSGTEYGKIKVPTHHKTSEFLLLSIFSAVNKNNKQSPMLRAIGDLMDGKLGGGKIDLVIFESGVKAGNQAPVVLNAEDTYENYVSAIKEQILLKSDDGRLTNKYNNQVVHTIPFEDYGDQVSSTEHLLDHSDIIGTQFRRLIDADLPDGSVFTLDGKKVTKQELHDFYQSILTEGIIESWDDVSDVFADRNEIERVLQKEMSSGSRYSDEERKACTLIETENGVDFQLPLSEPIQRNRTQQVLNSVIKKSITKQTARRGTAVNVSSVGLTKELNVRYLDTDGHLIYNETEWANPKKGSMPKEHYKNLIEVRKKFKSYEDYRNSVTASSQAYWEVYLPAYSRTFFNILQGDDGRLDINLLPDNMRKAFTFRTPTEKKYSMQAIWIKDFLPQQNASTIMFPADITATTGGDFDFDKEMIFLPEFRVSNGLIKEYNKLSESQKSRFESQAESENLLNMLGLGNEDNSDIPSGFHQWLNYMKENYPEEFKALIKENRHIQRINYDYSKKPSENRKEARTNALIDIAWSVFSNADIATQMVQPGGFDEVSRAAHIIEILNFASIEDIKEYVNETKSTDAYKKLFQLSKEEAENIAKKARGVLNPLSPLTQAYFHAQNANGGDMIPQYAISNTSHASGEWAKEMTLSTPINIFGTEYAKLDNISNENVSQLSDILAQFLGGSVDNVKDPVLTPLGQNTSTGDMTGLLARLGVPIMDIGLIMTCPEPAKTVDTSIELTPNHVAWAINEIANGNFNRTRIEGILSGVIIAEKEDRNGLLINQICSQVYNIRQSIKPIAKLLGDINKAIRADAMAGAAGPLNSDNIVKRIRLQRLFDNLNKQNSPIRTSLINFNLMFDEKYDTDHVRTASLLSDMPYLQASLKYGQLGAQELIGRYFPETKSDIIDIMTDKNTGLFSYINTDNMKDDDLSDIINQFTTDIYSYMLSGSDYFGRYNGMTSRRNNEYMLKEFPQDFKKMLEKYPELTSNGFIKRLRTENAFGKVEKITFSNKGGLSKLQKTRLTNDWLSLLTSENTQIRNFGFMLFKYGTISGLSFNPTGYMHLAPNVLKRAVPDYINSINALDGISRLNILSYVEQFVRNRLSDKHFCKAIDKAQIEVVDGDSNIYVAPKACVNFVDEKDEGKSVFHTWKFIKVDVDGKYKYYKYSGFNPVLKRAVYSPTTRLGVDGIFKEYYFGEESPEPMMGTKTTESIDAIQKENEERRIIIDEDNDEFELGDEIMVNFDSDIPTDIPEAKDPLTGQDICK